MNFGTPEKVLDTIRASDEVEEIRGVNRTKVQDLFNGVPPLSEEQAKRWNLKINTNFGEGPMLAANGRRQYDNAFLQPQNFFKVTLPDAPPEKATEWGMIITKKLNKIMKESEKFLHVHEYKWASVLAHGIGPQIWYDDESWCPSYVAVEDLRVATDTTTSFENLVWFAVRKQYTVGELSRKVFGPHADSGWNKPAIQKALDDLKNINYENTPYTWMTSPEKMAELVKQNAGFYSSDAVPTVMTWHFYYYNEDDPTDCYWCLCIVPDVEGGSSHHLSGQQFLYESSERVADDRENLLHVQFGDLNNKSPFMYHSVRSLGFLLVEPCFWTNLARCRYLQHVFEQFNIWLRSQDPGGRARAQMVELFDRCFVPEGISIVPQTERHQIDKDLVESSLAQLKQLMTEASQSYVQQLDTGTKKEQTAFETRVKLEAVNSMMSGLLGRAFRKEKFAYMEIARRFCLRRSQDPDVRKFQNQCRKAGVPALWLNVEYWEIEPEIPMGAGNPTMAQTQAQQLWQLRPACDPTAQQEILHEVIEITTNDPQRANRWAPIDGKRGVTDVQKETGSAFGTFMQGVKPPMSPESPAEQIEVLLPLLAGKIGQLAKMGNVATKQELAGLLTVSGYIAELIKLVEMDEQNRPRAKAYADQLGNLQNSIKGFAQRLAEQNKAAMNGNGQLPEGADKIISAKVKAKIDEEKNTQKMRHKEIAFIKEQRRKDAEAIANQQREGLKTAGETARKRYAAFSGGEE